MHAISIVFAVFIFSISNNVQAIVSMETLHLDEPVEGWKAGLDLSLTGALGNTENFRVNGGTLLLHHHNKVTHYLSFNARYGETSGIEDQNKSYLHFRRISALSKQWAWETFVQMEKNKFARLNLRSLVGVGGRYRFFSDKQSAFISGLGAFYSVDDIDARTTDNEGGKHSQVKGNMYLIYKRNFTKNSVFVTTTYFQPQLDKLNDFRLLENATFKFKLTENTKLKFSLDVVFDNEPPPSIKKADVSYSTGIELNF